MGFWELLKIELMKVKRGKMIPLLFIAPLLVVASGVANLQNYFAGIYQRMGGDVHSERFGLCLLSASVQHDSGMRDDCGTGNGEQRNFENVGPARQPSCPVGRKILRDSLLLVDGNGCFSCCLCDNRVDCNEQYRNYGGFTHSVFIEVVCRIIFYYASRCGHNVGHYSTI